MKTGKVTLTNLSLTTLTLTLLLLIGCKSGANRSALKEGSPFSQTISFQYAVYTPVTGHNSSDIINRLLAEQFPEITRTSSYPKTVDKPYLVVSVKSTDEYIVPDSLSIVYYSYGLSEKQKEDLANCKEVVTVDFIHPTQHIWKGLRSANSLLLQLGRETGGTLWDEETRETFTTDTWKQMRIDTWSEKYPAVYSQTIIHAYKKDSLYRAITLGMAKFGLPDIVVNSFPWSTSDPVTDLINSTAQLLAEGAEIQPKGKLLVNVDSIKNNYLRENITKSLESKASRSGEIELRNSPAEEGDPINRLVEIDFSSYKGNDIHSKQVYLLSQIFGDDDTVSYVDQDDDELQKAINSARSNLPKLRERFNNGLTDSGYLTIKAPFKVPAGGDEWMWVDVSSWSGSEVKGLLNNEPFHIPNLRKGEYVEVSEEEISDYIFYNSDGSQEGNFTGPVIEKIEQDRKTR